MSQCRTSRYARAVAGWLIVVSSCIAAARAQQPPTAPARLEGTAWNAIELYGMAVPAQSASTEQEPHVVFGARDQVSGADGCNRLTGTYTVNGNGSLSNELLERRWPARRPRRSRADSELR